MDCKTNSIVIGLVLLLAGNLSACSRTDESATDRAAKAGDKIGRTLDEADKKMERAVDKIGTGISQQSKKTEAVLDDVEITTRVKAAIFAEPGLKTLQISVDTINGVVTLSGSVDSQADSDTAKSLAGAVAGVKEVQNNLVLKPQR